MPINWSQEVERLFEVEAPELQLRPVRAFRGDPTAVIGVVYQAIVFGASVGAFGGLWKVCELLVQRYSSCRITVRYVGVDGTTIEVEYPHRTAAEAAAIVATHRLGTPREVSIFVTDASSVTKGN